MSVARGTFGFELTEALPARHPEGPLIPQTIESVLAQSHHAVEHLIVGDGSSDGSWAVMQRYASLPPERLRVQRVPVSRGASHARVRGATRVEVNF